MNCLGKVLMVNEVKGFLNGQISSKEFDRELLRRIKIDICLLTILAITRGVLTLI